MRAITNSFLSERTGIPHTKIRRWAKEFLPPDPRAGLRSGFTKEYSLNDSFLIYLGGHLVSELKFEVYEARRILQDLKSWLVESGQLPEPEGFVLSGEHSLRIIKYEILIVPGRRLGNFEYRVKGEIQTRWQPRQDIGRGKMIVDKKYLEYPLHPEMGLYVHAMAVSPNPGSNKSMTITLLLDSFMDKIFSEEPGAYENWKTARISKGIPTSRKA